MVSSPTSAAHSVTSSTPEARRALVTGASGFAGAHLMRQLAESGWSAVGRGRVEGFDICDRDALARAIDHARPEVIFHLAAIVDTVETPSVEELTRVNVGGTEALLAAASAHAPGARIVFTSSAFVYGSTTPDEQPISELQPLRPLTPYGQSKVDAEALVNEFVVSGGDAVIARAFQHTGPGHVGAYALADWAEQLARLKAAAASGVIATGNLDVERDYLDVRDVAAAYLALAERGERGGIYNVASGEPVTMRALLEGLIAAFDADATIETDPARVRAVDQPSVYADVSRLQADTAWRRSFTLDQTLADLAEFSLGRVSG